MRHFILGKRSEWQITYFQSKILQYLIEGVLGFIEKIKTFSYNKKDLA